jgi:hypothetical protein
MLRAAPGSLKFSLPGIVIDVGDFVQSPTGAMNTMGLMRAPVTVVYVMPWGGAGNNQDGAYDGMWALKELIDGPVTGVEFETFCRIEEGNVLSNVDCPINASLLTESQINIVCAALEYSPGLLVQLY